MQPPNPIHPEAGRFLVMVKAQSSPEEWREFLAANRITGREAERLAFLAQHRAGVDTNQTERCRALLLVSAVEAD